MQPEGDSRVEASDNIELPGRALEKREFTTALRGIYSAFHPLTMASVARRLGISESAVSHYLSGRRTPSEEILIRMHAAAQASQPKGPTNTYSVPHLLELRHRSHCRSIACPVCRLPRPNPAAIQGDRRNSR